MGNEKLTKDIVSKDAKPLKTKGSPKKNKIASATEKKVLKTTKNKIVKDGKTSKIKKEATVKKTAPKKTTTKKTIKPKKTDAIKKTVTVKKVMLVKKTVAEGKTKVTEKNIKKKAAVAKKKVTTKVNEKAISKVKNNDSIITTVNTPVVKDVKTETVTKIDGKTKKVNKTAKKSSVKKPAVKKAITKKTSTVKPKKAITKKIVSKKKGVSIAKTPLNKKVIADVKPVVSADDKINDLIKKSIAKSISKDIPIIDVYKKEKISINAALNPKTGILKDTKKKQDINALLKKYTQKYVKPSPVVKVSPSIKETNITTLPKIDEKSKSVNQMKKIYDNVHSEQSTKDAITKNIRESLFSEEDDKNEVVAKLIEDGKKEDIATLADIAVIKKEVKKETKKETKPKEIQEPKIQNKKELDTTTIGQTQDKKNIEQKKLLKKITPIAKINTKQQINKQENKISQTQHKETIPQDNKPQDIKIADAKQQNKPLKNKQPQKKATKSTEVTKKPQNPNQKQQATSRSETMPVTTELKVQPEFLKKATPIRTVAPEVIAVRLAKITTPDIPKAKRLTARQRMDRRISNVLHTIDKYLSKEIYVDNTVSILCAVSGGVDSIALLDALAILSEKYYYQVVVAHYDHSLRGEDSLKDEEMVREISAKYGFDYHSAKGDVQGFADKNGISIELAARKLRYSFFERTSRSNNIDFVMTAHTADDSVETFLLNLLRGTGLTGLSGIPSQRNFVKNVVIARPFISVKKSDIIAYAKTRDLKWREDISNQSMDYTRNKVRNELIPLLTKNFNPQAVEAINRAAKLIAGADNNINRQVQDALPSIVSDIRSTRFSVQTRLLLTFDEFMQGELLQLAINKYLRLQNISMRRIDAIMNLVGKTSGKSVEFLKGYHAIYDREVLIIGKLDDDIEGTAEVQSDGIATLDKFKIRLQKANTKYIKYTNNSKIEFFDSDKIIGKLTLRPWAEGDMFQPIGMDGSMKLSDFLINSKVPMVDKSNVLVLADEENIIWVCGYRMSDLYKITPVSKNSMKGEFLNV